MIDIVIKKSEKSRILNHPLILGEIVLGTVSNVADAMECLTYTSAHHLTAFKIIQMEKLFFF